LIEQYIAGSRTGKRSRTGERYFEEFRSRFWERPDNTSRREFTTNQRNRSASPTQRIPSERDENSSRDNVTYESSSKLINITSALNISASQNDSDFSMPDVGGGSQPLESINEEVIRPHETLKQCAILVRVPLQELISEGKRSVYHVHTLFLRFSKGKFVDHDYYRPRIHKVNMAICLDYMKLIRIDNVKPTKKFHYARSRY
ncbi:4656_t:CDS:2, partial [Diversispora eburnea]